MILQYVYIPQQKRFRWLPLIFRKTRTNNSNSRLLLRRSHLVPKGLHRHRPRRINGPTQEGRCHQVYWLLHQHVLDNFPGVFDDHRLDKNSNLATNEWMNQKTNNSLIVYWFFLDYFACRFRFPPAIACHVYEEKLWLAGWIRFVTFLSRSQD